MLARRLIPMLRPADRFVGFSQRTNPGPFRVTAAQVFCAGRVAGQTFSAGRRAGALFVSGAAKGQVHG